jgi:hypothetical protein
VELGNHAWGGETEVVATHVVGPVEESDRDPVETAPRSKTGGVGGWLGGCDNRHGSTLRIQGVEGNRKGGEFQGVVEVR